MKSLLIVCLFFVVTNAAIDKEAVKNFMNDVKKVADRCSVETNAGPQAVEEMFSHKVPSSKEGKCMLFCIHKHYKVQKDDGSVDREGAMGLMEEIKRLDQEFHDALMAIFIKCDSSIVIDADACQTAANIAECVITEAKASGLSDDFALE